MADLPVQPITNYGALLSSYGEGLANIDNAVTNNRNSLANVSMLPYQRGQAAADIAKTQTETQGLGLNNQLQAMKLLANAQYVSALKAVSEQNASGVNVGGDNEKGEDAVSGVAGSGVTAGGGGQSAQQDATFHDDDEASARMDALMDKKYRVNRAYTPQEEQFFQASLGKSAVDGNNTASENAAKWHDQRVGNDVAKSQKEAQKHYDSSYTIATAPEGRAYDFMRDIDPKFAAHAAAVHGADPDHEEKWTPAQKTAIDADIRKFATMANEKLTQYTGDTLEDIGGQYRNSRTKLPPIGGQTQGLAPQERAAYAAEGMKKVDYPDGRGGSYMEYEFKKEGFPNLDAYIRSKALAATGQSQNGQSSTNSDGKPTPPDPGAPGQPGNPAAKKHGPQVTDAANVGPVQGRNPNDPAIIRKETDPQMQEALRQATVPFEDGGYGVPKTLRGAGGGTTPDPDTLKLIDAQADARTQLLHDSGQAVSTGAQALQYMQAAKQLLDHPETLKTGPMGQIIAKASAILPGQHVDATNYQEVAKYLYNAAIQQGQTNFTRGLTDKDTSLQLQSLSPNPDMTSPAARDLLEGNIRNMQFSIDSANRVSKYLAAGGDPTRFPNWNNDNFNRSSVVNGPGGKPEAAPIVKRPGQEKSGEVKPKPSEAALAKLKEHPELAPQFKARYGFLPNEKGGEK